MINLLIVEKNMNYCKSLINSICATNDNIKLCGIANSIKEMLSLMREKQFDLILMDLNLSDYNIINNKKMINKKIPLKSLILILDSNLENKNIINESYVYDYIPKSNNFNEIIDSINLSLNSKKIYKLKNTNKEKIIKEKIKNELKILGYNMEHLGTKYLLETIYILCALKDYNGNNLEKDIYPIVAKKYGKTAHNIKCNIRNATEIMYYDNKEEMITEYLKDYKNCKVGTKIIISAILEKINN